MKDYKNIKFILFLNFFVLLLLAPSAEARKQNKPLFEYVAGTESLAKGCEGKLEVTEAAMVFECSAGSITVPYKSVTQMEYRPKISKEIRKMQLNWAIRPTSSRSKHQGYFTVLFSEKGQTRAMVLKVSPDTMRPYLAEIDLKTGMSIEGRQD